MNESITLKDYENLTSNRINKLNLLLNKKFDYDKIKACFGKFSNKVKIKKVATLDDIYVYYVYCSINDLYNDYYYYIYIDGNNNIINIEVKENYYCI